jgi:hypothetical protein
MTARITTAPKHVHTCGPKILYIGDQREAGFGHGTYHESLIEKYGIVGSAAKIVCEKKGRTPIAISEDVESICSIVRINKG